MQDTLRLPALDPMGLRAVYTTAVLSAHLAALAAAIAEPRGAGSAVAVDTLAEVSVAEEVMPVVAAAMAVADTGNFYALSSPKRPVCFGRRAFLLDSR